MHISINKIIIKTSLAMLITSNTFCTTYLIIKLIDKVTLQVRGGTIDDILLNGIGLSGLQC